MHGPRGPVKARPHKRLVARTAAVICFLSLTALTQSGLVDAYQDCMPLESYSAHMTSTWRRPMSLMPAVVAIGAALVLWSPNAAAQEALAVGACIADAKSLCSGIAGTGVEPLRGCFRDHVKEVSGACILSLAKLLEADPACKAPFKQQCADVEIGEGRLEACVRTVASTLSDGCKDAIVRAVPGAR